MKRERRADASRHEPEIMLAVAEARIAWVIDHQHMSEWLKLALRSADGLDPIVLKNDLEMLCHLVMRRAHAQVEIVNRSAIVN